METNEFSDFIERYLSEEMSDSEKKWFEKEIEGNDQLKSEVILRKNTDKILEKNEVISLRNKLAQIEMKRKIPSQQKSHKRVTILKYAAMVTVLLVIGSISLLSPAKMENVEIINNYYKTYEPPSYSRSGKVQTLSEFRQAVDLYNSCEYSIAIIHLNNVAENDPEYFHSVLLKGVVNFENKKYPEAQQSFIKIIDNNDNLFIEEASWYLSGCYLMTGQLEKAVQILNKIKAEKNIYSSNARKIIKNIN